MGFPKIATQIKFLNSIPRGSMLSVFFFFCGRTIRNNSSCRLFQVVAPQPRCRLSLRPPQRPLQPQDQAINHTTPSRFPEYCLHSRSICSSSRSHKAHDQAAEEEEEVEEVEEAEVKVGVAAVSSSSRSQSRSGSCKGRWRQRLRWCRIRKLQCPCSL